MAMKSARLLICALIILALFGCLSLLPRTAMATSGTITVNPGQTLYVGFGPGGAGDLLLWSMSISTWSTIFTYWLEKPDGTHLTVDALTSGEFTDVGGEWRLGFSIDASGWWSATVTYEVYHITPRITVSSPASGACVNQPTVTVSGTTEGWANKVEVTIDKVHYVEAERSATNWNKQITLPEGTSTINAKETIIWGDYWFSTTSGGVTVTYDKTPPAIGSVLPSQEFKFRKDNIWLSWEGADSLSGIDHYEVKIDDGLWVNVGTSTSYHFSDLKDGWHAYNIRAYDRAGNYAETGASVKTTGNIMSIDGPYYGIPLIAIIIAVILVALFVVLKYVRKPKQAPPSPPPEKPPLDSQ